jgi:hypothetical protein
MSMDIADIVEGLRIALPVLGTMTGHPEIAQLAAKLFSISEAEIERRQSTQGRTRSEVLADAKAAFAEAKQANDELKALGHE